MTSGSAFDRRGGPGRVLERDLQELERCWSLVPSQVEFWQKAAARAFDDVEATTRLRMAWRVVAREEEEVWPRRSLALPELWVEVPEYWGRQVPFEFDDVEEAVAVVADFVQEEVIEAVHTEWPRCPKHQPTHQHPMHLAGDPGGITCWRCPKDDTVSVTVGSLVTLMLMYQP